MEEQEEKGCGIMKTGGRDIDEAESNALAEY